MSIFLSFSFGELDLLLFCFVELLYVSESFACLFRYLRRVLLLSNLLFASLGIVDIVHVLRTKFLV